MGVNRRAGIVNLDTGGSQQGAVGQHKPREEFVIGAGQHSLPGHAVVGRTEGRWIAAHAWPDQIADFPGTDGELRTGEIGRSIASAAHDGPARGGAKLRNRQELAGDAVVCHAGISPVEVAVVDGYLAAGDKGARSRAQLDVNVAIRGAEVVLV